jgi:dGTPase
MTNKLNPHIYARNVRLRIEEDEERFLSPLATKSSLATRQREEEPSLVRTAFQHDRDRILHSKEFRRLKHKTQVFIAPHGDHYRTRLTHTLEVTQIARTVARALRLNEDLVEAIGLGHDIGHAPFGHAGEIALSRAQGHGFRHNEQSLRIVDILANDGNGLNLTNEVREGIYFHSKVRKGITSEAWGNASTLEGQIIKLSDSIAYINHDIDDSIRAGIIQDSQLPSDAVSILGKTHRERIDTMVSDLIEFNWWASGEGVKPRNALISMSPAILEASNILREFMFRQVYLNDITQQEEKVNFVINRLYQHFMEHSNEIADNLRKVGELLGDPMERTTIDHIAGMTDQYALDIFNAIYVPKTWIFDEKAT